MSDYGRACISKELDRLADEIGVSRETLDKPVSLMNEYEYEMVGQHLETMANNLKEQMRTMKPKSS